MDGVIFKKLNLPLTYQLSSDRFACVFPLDINLLASRIDTKIVQLGVSIYLSL